MNIIRIFRIWTSEGCLSTGQWADQYLFQAKVDQDVQLLYKVFGKEEDDRLEERKQQLKDEAVYIEDYQDITCYTKAGMTDDSYVVYVTYDVKFRRVDTLAPGLMWCYVVKMITAIISSAKM